MKRKFLGIIILLITSLFISSFNENISVMASTDVYEYEEVQYVDLGNILNVQEDFEMSLKGQNYLANATDLNTIISFGFKYKSELVSQQWFGFLTKDFQWLNNYSFTINNPESKNGYIALGHGSDADYLKFAKIESSEHFQEGQKYILDVGVIELFSDSNKTNKVAERFKVTVNKVTNNSYIEVASGYYDNYNFNTTITSRGKAFYFYLDEQLLISVGRYYKANTSSDDNVYEAKTKSEDYSSVLGVNANYKHTAHGDYYISGSGYINNFMSIGVTYTANTDDKAFVAFNVLYGTSWNDNYSFTFTRNGNITLGYGSDYQSWGFFNFGAFELNKKYIFEYGAVEIFDDEELTNKVGERIKVSVYKTNNDGTYTLMGKASYDCYENYYDFFPQNKRGNCTFVYQLNGMIIGCGFYNKDYKAVVVANDTYNVVDLSYGVSYDLSVYKKEKTNYQFTGWYYLNNGKKVFIPESGIWTYDFDTIIDGNYTCEVYANYEPNSYTITYRIQNGKNTSINKMSFSADETVKLYDPIVNEGYVFKGWYTSSSFTGEPINEIKAYNDVTIYAKIVKGYEVKFIYNNNPLKTIYIAIGDDYELPNVLNEIEVEKYVLNDIEISGKYKFSSDCEVFVYGKQKEYSITYYLDGANNSLNNPTNYVANSNIKLENASKDGYLFGGWYTDSQYKTQIKDLNNISGNLKLYARFFEISMINEINIIPSSNPFYLPQLELPDGSITTIKLFDINNNEIEISNKIYYYFIDEGTYKISYHVETIYGESIDKDVKLVVKNKNDVEDNYPDDSSTDNVGNVSTNNGCNGSSTASLFGVCIALFVLLKRKK